MARAHLALSALMCVACSEPPTEEERLRERIDTTKVHLYAAARYAIAGGDDPDAARTRAHMGEVITFILEHPDGTPPVDDVFALGVDLWAIRAHGQRIVRSEDEAGQRPILPLLLALGGSEVSTGALGEIDLSSEHAIFLTAFTVGKLDERVPVPIPTEIILYEAYRTRPEALTIPWLEPGARTCKAWIYATNDFCDLASREADAIDARSTEEWAALFAQAMPDAEANQRRQMVASMRAVVHGAVAQCYLARGDQEAAAPHLESFCDSAEELGTPPEDTALIRAYLAYRDGDLDATRTHLSRAKRSEHLNARQKREIDRAIVHLDREDTGALDRYFDGAFVATIVVRITLDELADIAEADGSADQASALREARRTIGALGSGIGAVQETEQAAESAWGSFWDSLFGD
jgi:hypothetical protein